MSCIAVIIYILEEELKRLVNLRELAILVRDLQRNNS